MTVGVLALHGDVSEHRATLSTLNVESIEVRTLSDLELITHLIIPGGESTVIGKFLKMTGVGDRIVERVSKNDMAVYGTCAGAILLATKVSGKSAPSTLGLMDITVKRNAYGTQAQSFETSIEIKGISVRISVAFIRAPKISAVGPDVQVLASHEGNPVLIQQGRLLAGTFHPEVRGETRIHEYFLRL